MPIYPRPCKPAPSIPHPYGQLWIECLPGKGLLGLWGHFEGVITFYGLTQAIKESLISFDACALAKKKNSMFHTDQNVCNWQYVRLPTHVTWGGGKKKQHEGVLWNKFKKQFQIPKLIQKGIPEWWTKASAIENSLETHPWFPNHSDTSWIGPAFCAAGHGQRCHRVCRNVILWDKIHAY